MKVVRNNLVIIFLLIINLSILIKLNFFIPQLSGKTSLLDFDTYYQLLGDIKLKINPYSVEYMQTQGPPLVFLYFLPFSIFNINFARSLITLVNILSGIFLCILLAKKSFPKHKSLSFFALTAILFSAFPTRFSIEIGQPILPIAFLITYILTSNNDKLKGISLSILITIKTFFLLTIFALFKKRKTILSFAIFYLLIFFVASLFIIDPAWYKYYYDEKFINFIFKQAPSININYYNQSLNSTLYRLGISSISQPVVFSILAASIIYILLTLSIELSIIFAIVLSPISWQHYYVVLFPILILSIKLIKDNFINKTLFIFSFFLWWIEFPWLHKANLNVFTAFLASHYFFSATLLAILIIRNKYKQAFSK